MPFIPNFATSQLVGLPSQFVIQDTSSSDDATITSRRIFLVLADGSYLTALNTTSTTSSYLSWAIADTTKTLDVLAKDLAIVITVQWLGVTNNVLYTKTILSYFTLYNETFDYSLMQMLSSQPQYLNDTNWWNNKSILRNYIDSGTQAIVYFNDQQTAQQCYDGATAMRINAAKLF